MPAKEKTGALSTGAAGTPRRPSRGIDGAIALADL